MPSRRRDAEAQLPEELADLERMLASFEPGPSRIDRDQMMFDAGAACGLSQALASGEGRRESTTYAKSRESATCGLGREPGAQSKLLPWPIATAAAVLLACLFGSLYVVERNRDPASVREIVYLERATPPSDDVVEASRARTAVPPDAVRKPSVVRRAAFYPGLAPQLPGRYPNYLALRQLILTRGVESLPRRDYDDDCGSLSELTRPPATIRQLMEEFLPSPAA
jgi:hypothetical protein